MRKKTENYLTKKQIYMDYEDKMKKIHFIALTKISYVDLDLLEIRFDTWKGEKSFVKNEKHLDIEPMSVSLGVKEFGTNYDTLNEIIDGFKQEFNLTKYDLQTLDLNFENSKLAMSLVREKSKAEIKTHVDINNLEDFEKFIESQKEHFKKLYELVKKWAMKENEKVESTFSDEVQEEEEEKEIDAISDNKLIS